jgi:hypothetical protein
VLPSSLATSRGLGGGELGGLLELVGVIDHAHAAAVQLAGQVQHGAVSERKTSLPLEQLLAFRASPPDCRPMPPPSAGPRDVTRGAVGHAHDDPDGGDGETDEVETADGPGRGPGQLSVPWRGRVEADPS